MGHIIITNSTITNLQQQTITLHYDPMGEDIISKELITGLSELLKKNTSMEYIFRGMDGKDHKLTLNPQEIRDHIKTYGETMGSGRVITKYDENGIVVIEDGCAQAVTPDPYKMLLVQDLIKSKLSETIGCPKQFITFTQITTEEGKKQPMISYMQAEPDPNELNKWIEEYNHISMCTDKDISKESDYLDAMRTEFTTEMILAHLLSRECELPENSGTKGRPSDLTLTKLIDMAGQHEEKKLAEKIWINVFFSQKKDLKDHQKANMARIRDEVLQKLSSRGDALIHLKLPKKWQDFIHFINNMSESTSEPSTEKKHSQTLINRPERYGYDFPLAIPKILTQYKDEGIEIDTIFEVILNTFRGFGRSNYKKRLSNQLKHYLYLGDSGAKRFLSTHAHKDDMFWPLMNSETYEDMEQEIKDEFKKIIFNSLRHRVKESMNSRLIRNSQDIPHDFIENFFQEVDYWKIITKHSLAAKKNHRNTRNRGNKKIRYQTELSIFLINSYFNCLENEQEKNDIATLLLERINNIAGVSDNIKKFYICMLLDSCETIDNRLRTSYNELCDQKKDKWEKLLNENPLIKCIVDERTNETGRMLRASGYELYQDIIDGKITNETDRSELCHLAEGVFWHKSFICSGSICDEIRDIFRKFESGQLYPRYRIIVCALLHCAMNPDYNAEPLQQWIRIRRYEKWKETDQNQFEQLQKRYQQEFMEKYQQEFMKLINDSFIETDPQSNSDVSQKMPSIQYLDKLIEKYNKLKNNELLKTLRCKYDSEPLVDKCSRIHEDGKLLSRKVSLKNLNAADVLFAANPYFKEGEALYFKEGEALCEALCEDQSPDPENLSRAKGSLSSDNSTTHIIQFVREQLNHIAPQENREVLFFAAIFGIAGGKSELITKPEECSPNFIWDPEKWNPEKEKELHSSDFETGSPHSRATGSPAAKKRRCSGMFNTDGEQKRKNSNGDGNMAGGGKHRKF